MIALDSGDKIRGDASVAAVVDYTLHGVDGTVIKQLADGQLAIAIGDLYTADSVDVVSTIILVNTHSVAITCNLYLTPSGGTARRLIPKDTTLGIGYSLHTNGSTMSVYDDSGNLLTSAIAAAHTIASHSDTTGTGPELDELTDGSETTLHSHAAAVTSPGEGHILILGHNYQSIGQGTWAYTATGGSGLFVLNWANDATKADDDNITYNVYLAAGTYTLRLLCQTQNNGGIVDIDFDAVEKASFDTYSAGLVQNVVFSQAAIAVAASGLVAIKLRLDGKNGASGAYGLYMTTLALWRTA